MRDQEDVEPVLPEGLPQTLQTTWMIHPPKSINALHLLANLPQFGD